MRIMPIQLSRDYKMELIIQGITIVVVLIAAVIEIEIAGDYKIACYLLSIGLVVAFLEQVIFHVRQEKKIKSLIKYLANVQNYLELPELKEFKEGNLAILQSEIYKMVAILQEQSGIAKKERTYLVDMLSDISHQVKTPLSAITIMVDLLHDENLPEEKRVEYVGKIQTQVNKITWLIRNLLTLSQLEANVLSLKKEDVKVQDIVNQVFCSLEVLADVREVELVCETSENQTDGINATSLSMTCDRAWTTEAIMNIVKNCVEHTAPGGKVSVEYSQHNLATTIIIRDNGCGITSEDLPYIFDRFYKGANPSENSVGIGLSMAKQILLKQNGNVTAKSVVGEGTEFTVKLY